MDALVALEDGRIFTGKSFGSPGERTGEVVFNTSMTGYQEILTDPSYKGQVVTMTYPLIGNYGINDEDEESAAPQVEGFIVREVSRLVSNWRAQCSLNDYLKRYGIIGIEGVDTRALTRHIRLDGAMRCAISTIDLDKESLIAKARNAPPMKGRDLVQAVTCQESLPSPFNDTVSNPRFRVIVYDFGVKRNILRRLASYGCEVTAVPAKTSAADALSCDPDGIFLSNGPGDPAAVPYVVNEVQKMIGKKPIFGICLGHQILGLSLGGRTFKLKFGHRGGNQPVMDLATHKVEITAQNHGFCVDQESLAEEMVEITHINLNDKTCEGLQHKEFPLFSVQYHPEACPGPHDADYLFSRFVELMERGE